MILALYQFLALTSVIFVVVGSIISFIVFQLIVNWKYRKSVNKFSHSKLSFKQKLAFNAAITFPSAIMAMVLSYLFVNSPIEKVQHEFLNEKIEYKKPGEAYMAKYLIKQFSSGDNVLSQGEFNYIQMKIGLNYNYLDLMTYKLEKDHD